MSWSELKCKFSGGHFWALHDKIGSKICLKCQKLTNQPTAEDRYIF